MGIECLGIVCMSYYMWHLVTCLPLSLVSLPLPLRSAAGPRYRPSSLPWTHDLVSVTSIRIMVLPSNLCWVPVVGMPSYSMFHPFDRVPTINGQ